MTDQNQKNQPTPEEVAQAAAQANPDDNGANANEANGITNDVDFSGEGVHQSADRVDNSLVQELEQAETEEVVAQVQETEEQIIARHERKKKEEAFMAEVKEITGPMLKLHVFEDGKIFMPHPLGQSNPTGVSYLTDGKRFLGFRFESPGDTIDPVVGTFKHKLAHAASMFRELSDLIPDWDKGNKSFPLEMPKV